ncbi:hypothetical protein GQ43DRAFT_80839 [Delitschia confertaspora ATCC 74209]|uniref:Uncharacterized protein n=1 Tax=Delitschia confertaspora ATCC 74209 TaxID=1513339 RepID=A0A9P4JND2_9PLEO|nr:hypothetical protein GQ43DRAFT_80839 [Delitschia confertaspora ATCC 74209]
MFDTDSIFLNGTFNDYQWLRSVCNDNPWSIWPQYQSSCPNWEVEQRELPSTRHVSLWGLGAYSRYCLAFKAPRLPCLLVGFLFQTIFFLHPFRSRTCLSGEASCLAFSSSLRNYFPSQLSFPHLNTFPLSVFSSVHPLGPILMDPEVSLPKDGPAIFHSFTLAKGHLFEEYNIDNMEFQYSIPCKQPLP